MREGTSGFWLENKDGEISIGYCDYCVSEFGGSDFERTYYLDKENSIKFESALKKEYKGTLKKMIESAFTKNFNDQKFWDFCKKHDIKYTTSTWTS